MSGPVSRFGLPDLGIGVGLRVPHYRRFAEERPAVDFLEILSENFMGDGGSPATWLRQIVPHYPVVAHGVSASLGGPENPEHTRRLVRLVRQVDPHWVSDHACWVGDGQTTSHDLLPLPFTWSVIHHMVDRIKALQDAIGRPFALENVSSYASWRADGMPEWEFLAQIAERADCALLLDINNVYVNSQNHSFDPQTFLNGLPLDRVIQIHLAGHETHLTHKLDTHDRAVCEPVWDLYRSAIRRLGPVTTLIEWDANIPELERLLQEAETARGHRDRALAARQPMPDRTPTPVQAGAGLPKHWRTHTLGLIQGVGPESQTPFAGNERLSPAEQLQVYKSQFVLRLREALRQDAPGLWLFTEGDQDLFDRYLAAHPPSSWTLDAAANDLADWLVAQGASPEHVALARVDQAVESCFFAGDGAPISPDDLAAGIPALELQPHVRLLRIDRSAHRWRAQALGGDPADPMQVGDFHLAIYRRGRSPRHLEMEPAAWHLLCNLDQGVQGALGVVLEQGLATPETLQDRLPGWFRLFTERGLVQVSKP